ncbi:DUF317 domain-containing protein [Streptomyces sp. DSM 41987]|uniref:DUF317 domain-containing protein n=1 Tax=Streptomyces TaxID=1883 RepID=UPI0018DF6B34|nr:DUF317 domain-containing protein [Streptomyces fildesensis]
MAEDLHDGLDPSTLLGELGATAASALGDLAPDAVLRVCPVYLAGRGDTAQIYETLSAHRWATAATDSGRMFTSPRQHAQIARLPEGSYREWKAVKYREPFGMPLWSATFSRNTPAEITAAFATALAKGLPSRHRDFLSGGTHYQSPNSPARVLAVRGWETTDAARHLYQTSRTNTRPSSCARTTSTHTPSSKEPNLPSGRCTAASTRQTLRAGMPASPAPPPLHLVRAAVVALTSADPVERTRGEIPERHLPCVDVQPVEEAPDPRRSSALAIKLPDVGYTWVSDLDGDLPCPLHRNSSRTAKLSTAWRSCDTPKKSQETLR